MPPLVVDVLVLSNLDAAIALTQAFVRSEQLCLVAQRVASTRVPPSPVLLPVVALLVAISISLL